MTALAPSLPMHRRVLKHPRAMQYNRLVVLALGGNACWLGFGVTAGWWTTAGADLGAIAFAAQANLAAAVLVRKPYVINALGWLATRPPTTWPLRVRWALGEYYHLGGLHVGTAIAGTASHGTLVLGATIATAFTVMVVTALPPLRAAQHDRFEVTHRFCGWVALVLVWANTLLFDVGSVWLVALNAALAAWPWLLLRRVPITVERPSSHAAMVRLYSVSVPAVGTTRPISRSPVVGWLADNDVVLDDAEISRHHAVVSDTGTTFVITDLSPDRRFGAPGNVAGAW